MRPDLAPTLTCARCGVFVSAATLVQFDTRSFCADCAKRPEVDYVEAYRLAHWGRRDGFAYLFGLVGVVFALASAGAISGFVRDPSRNAAASTLVWLLFAYVGLAFFFRARHARWLSPVFPLLMTTAVLTSGDDLSAAVLVGGLSTIPVLGGLWSVHSRLFFKLEVPRGALERSWRSHHDNPLARGALLASVFGLVVPGASLVGLVAALVALRRVDPGAFPPIGGRNACRAALVVGALGVLEWLFLGFG